MKAPFLDWDKLRIFYTVAGAGSLTQAGDILGLSQSSVSRQISSLEDSLQVSLFHRHARGLMLTEQGDLLFQTAKEIFKKMTFIEAQLKDNKYSPKGELRLTTTIGFGSVWLMEHLPGFMKTYPDIAVRLLLDDRELDLAMRQADIALRMGKPENPSLVQRPLFSINYKVWASKEYVQKYGTPVCIEDLDHHRLIVYGETVPYIIRDLNWLITVKTKTPRIPALTINNVHSMAQAVEAGVGIAMLPQYITAHKSDLIPVLEGVELPSFQTYLVYPEELRNTNRLTLFRDYLLNIVEKWQF